MFAILNFEVSSGGKDAMTTCQQVVPAFISTSLPFEGYLSFLII